MINDCKESTEKYECDKCKDYYYFDEYMNELSVPYKCCGEGTFWDPELAICSAKVTGKYNLQNCRIYNSDIRFDCMACDPGYYISFGYEKGEGYCCPEG